VPILLGKDTRGKSDEAWSWSVTPN
jgi:hypothetical protein